MENEKMLEDCALSIIEKYNASTEEIMYSGFMSMLMPWTKPFTENFEDNLKSLREMKAISSKLSEEERNELYQLVREGKEIPEFLGDTLEEKVDRWLKYGRSGVTLKQV